VPAESLLGPYDVEAAYPLTDERLYVGRLLRRRSDGQWLLFAFRNAGEDGAFVGGVTDPMPVDWEGERLVRRDAERVAIA
jgi:beta-fructofuranosidase